MQISIVPLQYSYMFGSILFLIIYICIYYLRKDLRREMIWSGLIMAPLVFFGCLFMCTYDWWRPGTVTNTRVGFEDLIFGFSIGGITAVIYDVVLGRHYTKHKWNKTKKYIRFSVVFTTTLFFCLSLYLMGMKSFYAYYITSFLGTIYLWHVHRSLIGNSLLSGVLTTVVAVPIYLIMNIFTPGWIHATYLWESLSGITFLTIPIEEIYYYFFTGIFFGPMYEYLKRID